MLKEVRRAPYLRDLGLSVETFAGAVVDRAFPRRELKRSVASLPLDAATVEIFAALRERAAN